ncbi:hypothetical protein V6N13_091172 [Hibiscus sabdariffa]
MRMQNQEATLKYLENQVGQISQVLKSRPIGGFPSDTEVAKGSTHEKYTPASAAKDHEIPVESEEVEITIVAPQPKQFRKGHTRGTKAAPTIPSNAQNAETRVPI